MNNKPYVPRWGISIDDGTLCAVGRLVIFAGTFEQVLQNLFWYYGKIHGDIGVFITEDMKPKTLMEFTLKFAREREANEKRVADLNDIFRLAKDYAEQRNAIIHWHWNPALSGEHYLISPHTTRKKQPKKFTTSAIDQLADDYGDLARRARMHFIPDDIRLLNDIEHDTIWIPHYPQFWPVPWLDKPSQEDGE